MSNGKDLEGVKGDNVVMFVDKDVKVSLGLEPAEDAIWATGQNIAELQTSCDDL